MVNTQLQIVYNRGHNEQEITKSKLGIFYRMHDVYYKELKIFSPELT